MSSPVDNIWKQRMRGQNFEDTLRSVMAQLTRKSIEAIKEVDEDCYDSSNYNSVARLEPMNESVSQPRDSAEAESKPEGLYRNLPGQKNPASHSQFYNDGLNDDSFKKDQRGEGHRKKVLFNAPSHHPLMHVKDGAKGTLKSVMNNISQTTKIIINNIGSDFQKKPGMNSTQDGYRDEHPFSIPLPGSGYKRPDSNSAERRSSVNLNSSRPISKRSSEDVKPNEFIVKDYPRLTSNSNEHFRPSVNLDRDDIKRRSNAYSVIETESWRDNTTDADNMSDARYLRKSKKNMGAGEQAVPKRTRHFSSTLTSNVFSNLFTRGKKSGLQDIRSFLFSKDWKKSEGGGREARRAGLPGSGSGSFRKAS